MTNVMPAGPGSNEGSVAWTQISGTTAVITNDTAHPVDGTHNLKIVSAASGTVILHATQFAITGGVTLTTNRSTGFASTSGLHSTEFYDFFKSDGTTPTTSGSNDILDPPTTTINTTAYDLRTDTTSPIPADAAFCRPGIQAVFTASLQSYCIDAWTADDGLSVTNHGIPPGFF